MTTFFQSFINFVHQLGNNIGWASNIAGVGTVVVGIVVFLFKHLSKKRRRKEYSDFSSMLGDKFKNSEVEIYKTKTIAIVDDNPEHYPIDSLNKCGYRITPIESISLSNVNQLLTYDLLVLDITNIVKEDLKKGGLTLLKKIKAERPDMLTIAASSKRYDPTLTEFFKLADDQIKTPIEHQEFEEKIIKVLNEKFCYKMAGKKLDDLISGKDLTLKQRQKIIHLSKLLMEKDLSEEKFLQKVARFSHLADTRELKNQLKIVGDML